MEQGVDEAFRDACAEHDMDWSRVRPALRDEGRFHVETY
jgi:benzoyl-CoA 2,3-dioxygenase component A